MSTTRAVVLAAFASAGVLAAGWQVGTAGGQTIVGAASSTTSAQGATSPSDATPTHPPDPGTETTTGSGSSTSSVGTAPSGTFTGATATHRYGNVTVSVTLSNGQITSLSEEVASDGDPHSERINAQAVPMLRSAVLKANSADVSTIGGATYTSQAYLTSLQSALDQIG